MDIDSFYQDGDMTFGMDGRIYFADDERYLNLFGGKKKAENRSSGRAEEVKKSYPVSDNCGQLNLTIANIKQAIADSEAKLGGKVGRGDRRVTTDYLNAMRNQKSVLENKQRELKCLEKQEQEELGSFMSQLKGSVSGGTSTTQDGKPKSNTMTYVLIGVGGLLVLGMTIFVIKKVKNQ